MMKSDRIGTRRKNKRLCSFVSQIFLENTSEKTFGPDFGLKFLAAKRLLERVFYAECFDKSFLNMVGDSAYS